jgi:hypothetical protein
MREMISTGNGAEKAPTPSNSAASPMASANASTTSRTMGSRDCTARGVNTRLTRARSRSWSGGSIMMVLAQLRIVAGSDDGVCRSTPWLDENVRQSLWAAITSSSRDRA